MKLFNKKNKGSALVEFALISTVMIPILLYTQYFSEAIHIQMKADEMNYFIGWELAAFKITDYGQNQKNSAVKSRLDTARETVTNYAVEKYSDFDSADTLQSPRFIMISPEPFTNASVTSQNIRTSMLPQQVDNTGESNILTSILSFLNGPVDIALGIFSFNYEHAGVKSKVNVKYKVTERLSNTQKYMNRTDAGGKGGFFNGDMINQEMVDGINAGNGYTSPEFVVWFDTWSLADGSNVEQGMYSHPFTKQVDRMMFFGLFNSQKNLSGLPGAVETIFNTIGTVMDTVTTFTEYIPGMTDFLPWKAHVSAYNYDHSKATNYSKTVDGGQVQHETIPLWYHGNKDETGYSKSLEIRRNFYMGNGRKECNYKENCEP